MKNNNAFGKEVLSSGSKNKITCSFLIPKNVYGSLTNLERNKIGKNLEILLIKYRNRILKSKRFHNRTATSLYQKKGNDLLKFNVRISAIYWEQLTVLARSHGVSNCYLYQILLLWEYFSNFEQYKRKFLYKRNSKQKIALLWILDVESSFSWRTIHSLNPTSLGFSGYS
ncbi:DUF1564 family protein [Leptospira ellisii]|uniref:DUF1564 family protein n=2 Tax=Leptospira ellisii TaxID=2023197 RepID=A0AAE4QLW9_9LEPT|nr:DUF1564 family protein [Leptospira ellisii]MDV6235443.1 DUF1564 family protein [Leptospira ellisii]PKA06341.1 hypothetical protein CH375_00070 [Leptospira ellisii]